MYKKLMPTRKWLRDKSAGLPEEAPESTSIFDFFRKKPAEDGESDGEKKLISGLSIFSRLRGSIKAEEGDKKDGDDETKGDADTKKKGDSESEEAEPAPKKKDKKRKQKASQRSRILP
jgi:hypothetical protein